MAVRVYIGAALVIAGIAAPIEAHSHRPVRPFVCPPTKICGLSASEVSSHLSTTAYDLLRIGAWALVIVGGLTVALWADPLLGASQGRRMTEASLTYDEALFMLNDHLGKEVSVCFSMTGQGGPWPILPPLIAELGKRSLGRRGRRDVPPAAVTRIKESVDPLYTVGGQPLSLPPLPGEIRPYEFGLEWVLAEGLTLRINWGGGA
jgi:hypothetical protein